jgi:HEAT repeat protein
VQALVKIGSPRAIAALTEAFPHPDPLVSGRAALARGQSGEAEVIPALIDLVVEGRDDVEAADVLALLANQHGYVDDITDAVAAALTRAGDRSRQRLAEALGGITGPRSRTALAGLASDADPGVAATATFLLRQREGATEQSDGNRRQDVLSTPTE